jgi:hypothetical protein
LQENLVEPRTMPSVHGTKGRALDPRIAICEQGLKPLVRKRMMPTRAQTRQGAANQQRLNGRLLPEVGESRMQIVRWESLSHLIDCPGELANRWFALAEQKQGQLFLPVPIQLDQKFDGMADSVMSGFVKQGNDGRQVIYLAPVAQALPAQGPNPLVRVLDEKRHRIERLTPPHLSHAFEIPEQHGRIPIPERPGRRNLYVLGSAKGFKHLSAPAIMQVGSHSPHPCIRFQLAEALVDFLSPGLALPPAH